MMQYKIITSEGSREEDIEDFAGNIQMELSGGWELNGSPYTAGSVMCQAMTFYEKVYEMDTKHMNTETRGPIGWGTGYDVTLSMDLYKDMMELAKRFYFFYVGAEFEDMHELGDVPHISNLEILFMYLAKIEDRAVFRSIMYSIARVGGSVGSFPGGRLWAITPEGHTGAEVLFKAIIKLSEEEAQQFVLDALGVEDVAPFSFGGYMMSKIEVAEMNEIRARVKACL